MAEQEQIKQEGFGAIDQKHKDLVGGGLDPDEKQEENDELSPAQEKAMNGGWNPDKADWDGDPDEWVDAPEFNRRGELMARISQLGRKVGDAEKVIEKLTAMQAASDKVQQKIVDDTIQDTEKRLKAQRREALREQDFEAIDAIEEDLDELKEVRAKSVEPEVDPASVGRAPSPIAIQDMSPTQRVWYDLVTTTPWIQGDKAVHDPLLKYGEEWLNTHNAQDHGTADFLEAVLDKANELRGKPRNKKGPRGPDDGKGGAGRTPRSAKAKGGKYSSADLNAQQKAIAAEFVTDGIIDSVDEYAAMMAKEGHLDSQR